MKGDILKWAEILLNISCSSIIVKEWPPKDFPGGPVVPLGSVFPLKEAWVPSLVGELRSCVPHSLAKK